MNINWNIVATIAAPLITLFVGMWLNRRLESRPFLVSYFGHVAAFLHNPHAGQPIHVHTHSVVLRNSGRESATNVRLHHATLPDFQIWPQLIHHVEHLDDGSSDIVIPTMVPKEEVTISYLYFPPLTFAQINAGIKCDQGFAHAIPVLLQRQYPRWLNRLSVLLMLVGIVSILYLTWLLILGLLR